MTLLDKLHNMLSSYELPKSMWIEALMDVYILNWVLTKAVTKTQFELLKGWKPNL